VTEPTPLIPGDRHFFFSPSAVDPHGDRLVATVDPPDGTQVFWTNILAGPRLVKVGGGLERVGRTVTGYAVLRRVTPGRGPVQVVIETAKDPAIVAGRWVSLLGLLGAVIVLLGPLLPARRCRREPNVAAASG
jgi:hypothetical protein